MSSDLVKFDETGAWRPGAVLALCGAVVAAAALVVALVLVGGGSTSKGSHAARSGCAPSGCAIVDVLHTTPRVTVFYGASCTGTRGPWYLNVAQEAPSGNARAAYSLRWTFPAARALARPNGTITVSAGGTTPSGISMTLEDGILTVRGTSLGHPPVEGTGTLSIQLTGSGAAQYLTIVEKGLTSTESALGLVSPFANGGDPVQLPVTITDHFASC